MGKLLYEEETYAILGACFSVYKELGHGFLESVYQECLEIEFMDRRIPYVSQAIIPIRYKHIEIKTQFRADFVCFDRVIMEIKACSSVSDEHRAQILNYLRATRLQVGLLVNFGHVPDLEYHRFVLT